MLILAFESSCDETAASVTLDGRTVLADEIYSQADMHALYGGVVPEIASRNHITVISKLADSALKKAGITKSDLDAIAVTYAPGLIGALLVGVNFAKGAAMSLGLPLIPVHHIRGHIAANYIAYPELEPPFLALVISGGHSLIVDVRGYTDMSIIGTTRDDAAGECFDKAARVLGLGYPGGRPMDLLARTGDDKKYPLPRAKVDGNQYDMSFSGLKTAVVNTVHNAKQKGESLDEPSLAASFAAAVSDTLVPRTMDAARELGYDKIVVAGGVAANSRIRADFEAATQAENKRLFIPPLSLCGDNGAMIGCQAYYEYLAGARADSSLNAYANMDIDKLRL
jgi:N6-L-threonylcarbamoyladenine synthase